MYIPYPALPICIPPLPTAPLTPHVQWRRYGHDQLPWILCAPATHTEIGEEASQLLRVANPQNKKRAQIAKAPRGSGDPSKSAPGARGAAPSSSQSAIAPRGIREIRASRRSEPRESKRGAAAALATSSLDTSRGSHSLLASGHVAHKHGDREHGERHQHHTRRHFSEHDCCMRGGGGLVKVADAEDGHIAQQLSVLIPVCLVTAKPSDLFSG